MRRNRGSGQEAKAITWSRNPVPRRTVGLIVMRRGFTCVLPAKRRLRQPVTCRKADAPHVNIGDTVLRHSSLSAWTLHWGLAAQNDRASFLLFCRRCSRDWELAALSTCRVVHTGSGNLKETAHESFSGCTRSALAIAGSSFAQVSGNPTGMDQRYAPTLSPGASSSYEHSPRSAFFLPPADRRDSSLRITASHLEFGCQERMWGRPSCRRADRPNRRRSRRVGRTRCQASAPSNRPSSPER